MESMSIFDLLPEDEAKKYKPIKSTDWKYITCMSVPPIMIKRIVTRLIESGLFERRE